MMIGDPTPSAAAPRVILDNNALDVISESDGVYSAVREAVASGRLVVLWTHVTIDEAAATPDPEKRGRLLSIGAGIAWLVPTANFVLGVSRLDVARLGPDEDSTGYASLRGGTRKRTHDALIGATAIVGGAMLATRDVDLTKRARARGVEVIDPADLPSVAERA